jgi:hypothetical protein
MQWEQAFLLAFVLVKEGLEIGIMVISDVTTVQANK